MAKRFTPYEGQKPYIFLSYAREDTDLMLEAANRLKDDGYRLWYDEGIPGGNDWPLYIAEHLEASGIVLFFFSGKSMVSPNCLNEMMAAQRNRKSVICVCLDEDATCIGQAVTAQRALSEQETLKIRKNTEAYAKRRKSDSRIPEPMDWIPALNGAFFADGQTTVDKIIEQTLQTSFLTDQYKGSYETNTGRSTGLNRWLIGSFACIILLVVLVAGGVRMYQNEKLEQNKEPVIEEPVRETIDPALFYGKINSNISFPDELQEKVVRKATGIASGEIEDSKLACITQLLVCGNLQPDSREQVHFEDGKWIVNGAPVGEGKISDLSLIKQMYYLEKLELIAQKVKSVHALSDLPYLTHLDISGNPIKNLRLESGFEHLETLNISHTDIRSLVGISAPASLQTIYVSADMLPMELDPSATYEVELVK